MKTFTFTFIFLDNFNDATKFFFGPLNKFFTFIGSIRPNFFDRLHDGKGCIPILHTGFLMV